MYDGTNEELLTSTHDFGIGQLNLETTFDYNAWGDVTSITDPRGNTTTFEFDNERRMTLKTECTPFEFESSWEYDDNGQKTSFSRETGEVDPALQTWQWSYLANGLTQTITDPAGNETNFEYDNVGRLSERIDAENRRWRYQYDAVGRISVVTDPMGKPSETRTYTDNGLLETITDARNNTTEYEYDGFDRLKKRIYPDATFEGYTYNANNQVLTLTTRAGDVITNTYDVLTRLETRDPDSLPLQTMTYDLAGRLEKLNTPSSADPTSGDYEWLYDTAGRLLTQKLPDAREVTYELDENGNKTKLIWPDSYYVEYFYDELNRLTDIKLNGSGTAAVHFDYDDLSRRTLVTYENGCTCAYAWEINDDLSDLEHTFDSSSVAWTFAYNKVHQVASKSVDNTDYAWPSPTAFSKKRYGSANNLNQYPSVQGAAQDYDDNGNLTSGVLTATFDVLNRMTQAMLGGNTVDFIYDPNNRQAQKYVSSVDTGFLYDGVSLIAEYDGSTLEKRYIPGASVDETFVIIQSSTKTYLHMDRLGSVIAVSDSSGDVLNSFKYGPFGEMPSLTGTPFGYTGQRYDSELQSYYYKSRYYLPALGRFLQADPIGYESGDMNQYAYVGNDSQNQIDPAGTISKNIISNSKTTGLQAMLPPQIARETNTIGGESIGPVAAPGQASAIFDMKKGTLTVSVGNQTTTANNVFTGMGDFRNNPASASVPKGAIPPGQYYIGKPDAHGNYQLLSEFGTEVVGFKTVPLPQMSMATDPPVFAVRSNLLLHPGLISYGCVTVTSDIPRGQPGYPFASSFQQVSSILGSATVVNRGLLRPVPTLGVLTVK